MTWKFSFNNNLKSHALNMSTSILLILVSFILSSCATMDQSVDKMKGYLPDIKMNDFIIGEETSVKKERLLKTITPLKETRFVFSPIISLKDLNKEGLQKNKFFLAGEIYSKNPLETVSALSSDNCYSPQDQGSINKMERLYHVFLKNLGLDSSNANELDGNENINAYFLIQPVLLKYQYCNRAHVEIRYLIQNNAGDQTSKTIKTSHKAKNFKLPDKEENYPFFNYNDPETQFPELRHALTMAFHENTMNLVKMMSEVHRSDETK